MSISILITTCGREKYLQKTLKSLFKADKADAEVIVLLNGLCAGSERIFKSNEFTGKVKVIHSNTMLSPGSARNELVSHSTGEILYFIDDDVEVDEKIFTIAVQKFRDYPDVDIIGGPNLTPADSTRLQKIFGYFFESYFGAGQMSHRYLKKGRDTPCCERKLILCNLAIRASIFKKNGFSFHDEVPCNEENILLQQLEENGKKMMYCPDLIVYHHRREGIVGFAEQLIKYGRGRAQNMLLHPKTFSPVFLLPSLLTVTLIFFTLTNNKLSGYIILTYFILAALASVHKGLTERDIISSPQLFFIFPIAHISYSLGFFYQFFKKII